jgi:DNA repair exonuclease SbcCD nuclease subunit
MSHGTLTALCIGDVHIQTSNVIQTREFIIKLKKLLTSSDSNDIDIVILMGDILHSHERLHTIAFNYANELFTMISELKKTYILVGNHDLINNSQFLTSNHWMNCFKGRENITIVDDIKNISHNGVKITLCPFVPDGRFIEALKSPPSDNLWESSECIFAHQLFDGAKMGAIVAEGVEKWDEKYPLVISGHIHDKQRVQPNLYYTGSSVQHAFGESSDKTLLKIKLFKRKEKGVDDSADIERVNDPFYTEIDLDLPKKKIIYMSMEELEKFDITSIDSIDRTEYKLTIDGSYEEFTAFRKSNDYKTILKKGVKIVFKHKRAFIAEKKEQYKREDGEIDNNNKPYYNKKSFNKILEDLIKIENNPFLDELMSSVVMNRTSHSSILEEIIIVN